MKIGSMIPNDDLSIFGVGLAQCLWSAFSMHKMRLLHENSYFLPPVVWEQGSPGMPMTCLASLECVCTQGCIAELLFSFFMLVDGSPDHYSAQMWGIFLVVVVQSEQIPSLHSWSLFPSFY